MRRLSGRAAVLTRASSRRRAPIRAASSQRFCTGGGAADPPRRFGQPADIAPAAVFLASDDARWVTGETLFASGRVREEGR